MTQQNKDNSVVKQVDRPRAIILSPLASQPRYHRRADMLVKAGYDVKVYSFRRIRFEENTYPDGVEVVDLGEVKDLKYLSRIPLLLRAMLTVHKQEKKANYPALVYAFGLDMALVGSIAMPASTPLLYEVGDVADPLPHTSVISKIIEFLEKRILSRCVVLVVTSLGFVKEYFSIIAPGIEQKTIVIENMISRKVARKFPRPEQHKVPVKPLKIGFVGLFRYKDSTVAIMDAVAKRKGDFELHFYGDGFIKDIINDYADRNENIFNHGSFKSVTDMKMIYEAIDISYIAYDNRRSNVRMALPNKLYEAPYFGVPVVVSTNTYLSERVKEMNSGFVVDPQDEDFAGKWLDSISPEIIEEMSRNLLSLDEKYMVESYDEIVPKLIELGKTHNNA